MPQRPLVLGHRGARHAAPENTLQAFELAMTEGADGVELDVRLGSDDEVVVLHDRTLKRVTGGADSRDVETLSAFDLANVDVGSGQRVPVLGAVLDWAKHRGALVNIELKGDVSSRLRLVRAVLGIVRASGLGGDALLFSSFHPQIVFLLARAMPNIPAAWLVHDGQRLLKYTPGHRLLGAAAVHPQATLVTRSKVERWKRSGLLVNVWTVNDVSAARELSAIGVDAIISDVPGAVVRSLQAEPRPGHP